MLHIPVTQQRKRTCTLNDGSKYWDQIGLASSVDHDQTAPKEQSDHGLHCLSIYSIILIYC